MTYLAIGPGCVVDGLPRLGSDVTPREQFMIETATLAQWSRDNAADLGASKAAFDAFVQRVDRANGPGRWQLHMSKASERGRLTASSGPLLTRVGSESSTCVIDGIAATVGGRNALCFKRRLHSLLSMGLNANGTAYPAFAAYREAEPFEVSSGLTRNFLLKHVSLSQSADQGKRVAKLRMRLTGDTVPAFGNTLVSRSTTIDAADADEFQQEVFDRRTEFAETYEALADWFVRASTSDRYIDDIARADSRKAVLIDHVTFVSKSPYKIHEYERSVSNVRGTQARKQVQFGLAPGRTGGWAVHHLAGTGPSPGSHGVAVSALGVTGAVDALTHVVNPFA